MRQTRAAARAAQEEPVLAQQINSPTPDLKAQVTTESQELSSIDTAPEETKPKAGKGKKKGRPKKAKKTKTLETPPSTNMDTTEEAVKEQPETGITEAVVAENIEPRIADTVVDEGIVERPASPTVKNQRLRSTRTKKPKMEEESQKPEQSEPAISTETSPNKPELALASPFGEKPHAEIPAVLSPVTRDDIEAEAGAKASIASTADSKSNAQSTQGQRIPSQSTSLITSPTITISQSEDPIDALDALEDAIEQVGKILPKIAPLSPEKKTRNNGMSTETMAAKRASQVLASRTKPPSIPPTQTKASLARLASLKEKQGGSLMKSTQPSALSRSTSLRATASRTPSGSSITTKKTAVAAGSSTDAAAGTSKPVDYLASKRRPISMQFPPPPQPIKSCKPLTKPTFTLPGEAYAAKRKAQLEEKLKREEEEAAKKKEFKARPVPKARPQSMMVRQSLTSRARQSMMYEDESEHKENIPEDGDMKRSNTVSAASSRPVSMMATKRASMILGRSPANSSAKRNSRVLENISGPTIPPLRQSTAAAPRTNLRTTTQPSATSRTAPRPRPLTSLAISTSPPPAMGKTAISAEEAALLKQKGREIFNRDRVEKESRERERREKEDAARRARAEAAEKGRQASREWAEKQKQRLLMLKPASTAQQTGSPVI